MTPLLFRNVSLPPEPYQPSEELHAAIRQAEQLAAGLASGEPRQAERFSERMAREDR